ncbi:MAG: flagellar hook-associated protein FlgK [Epsilonproteobacteria bacterium]|nr:flagellar hook-associated protein FlgK [Campylobacterota bacterium]
MGVFDSLHIGYSGLSASQTAINTTSHNIANANTEGYSKQSVTQRVNAPIHNLPGDVGAGTHIATITRAHDEFVYGRLKSSSAQVAYSEYMEKTLQEISNYTTDLEDLGIAKDLQDFFAAWSDVAHNAGDESQKIVLLQSMDSLAQNMNESSSKLADLQDRLNEEFKIGINEVNRIASEIVELNSGINKVENSNSANANDLRDQRDQLELELAKLLNIQVSKGHEVTEFGVDPNMTDQGTDYNINIGGFNIVDGTTFHPLRADDNLNTTQLNAVYYRDQNHQNVDMTGFIRGGELGAILDLRGDKVDSTGRATNSKIQDYMDDMNTFAKTLIHSVNNLYASSAQEGLQTDSFGEFNSDHNLINFDGVKEGSFDLKVYDELGNAVATRTITIDETTTLDDIVANINQDSDDNGDNDGTNDLDDLFVANITTGNVLSINARTNTNYTIAIEDNGTNFAGATGINKLFEGDSADTIRVATNLQNNPANIASHQAPIDGNSDLANKMVELQYANVMFESPDGTTTEQGLEAYYRYSSSRIASDAHQATINKDASAVLHNAINTEFKSVSGVDMDEELVNLMKYQTAYQANAKIISTVDQMIDTLLGMR